MEEFVFMDAAERNICCSGNFFFFFSIVIFRILAIIFIVKSMHNCFICICNIFLFIAESIVVGSFELKQYR